MRTRSAIHLAVADLADRNHGVVSRTQLLELGLSRDAIGRRIRSGGLRPLHKGVYAVGHRALRPEGHWLAAVLAGGAGAVLSHASAALLWGLRPSAAALIDVTIPTDAGRRGQPGIRLHRCATLTTGEVTASRRIPVTTPARTLLDLAATLPRRAVERAVDQAELSGIFDLVALDAVITAHRGRPGAPLLASVVATHDPGATPTRSELEERFLAFCAAGAIPRPLVNVRVAGIEVDFHWPDRRLVVELDGFRYHGTRAAFERDRARDAVIAAAGWRVLRFSHRQLSERPAEVAGALGFGPRGA